MDNKRKKVTITAIIVLLLIGLCSWFFILHQNGKQLLDFDKSAKVYKSKIKKPEEWSKENIAFPAFKEVKVLKGSEKGYMALENPSFNNAYLQFSLTIDGEKNPFFESGLVKPGEAITEVSLPKNLSAGNYKVVLSMKAYAPNDNKTKLNGTNANFTLRVLEKGE